MAQQVSSVESAACFLYYTQDNGMRYWSGAKLKDGWSLWKIMATYAKSLASQDHYVMAKSAKEARRRFLRAYPWLSYITAVKACQNEEERKVLSEPDRHIIVLA